MALWNDRLRQERVQRNWRQHDLAEKLGTSVVTIQRWERGSHQPSAYFRIKLCALFGKSAQELGFVSNHSSSTHSSKVTASAPVVQIQANPAQEAFLPAPSPTPSERPGRIYDPAIPSSLLKEDALVGRDLEFHLLKQHLLTHTGSFSLYGLPGVGKTALAIALAHDPDIAARFPDGIFWAGLGREPDRFRLLSRWGSLLGLTSLEMTTAKSKQFEVLAEMLRDAIGSRRILLVLDDAWEVTTALDFQVGGGQCVHLVTTRFPPLALHVAGGHALALHELTEQDSLALLRRLAPAVVTEEGHEVRDLVRSVGGLPLALTLMGRYLQVQAHDRQPRRIRQALEQLHNLDTRLRLTAPQTSIDRHPSLPASMSLSLQAAIAISEQQLDAHTREKFRALSTFPAKSNSFSEAAALAVCGLTDADLDRLTDAGLVESYSPGRYTLHQVIADYAHQHCARTTVEEPMVRFFVGLVQDAQQQSDLLEQEYSNILAAFEIARQRGMAAELQQGINRFALFLLARGLYNLGVTYLNQALQAAVSTGDEEELAWSWFYLGRIAHRRGDYQAAEHSYLEGLSSARKVTNKELRGQLLAYAGDVILYRGDWRRAERYSREGLELAQTLGNQSISALILRTLGDIADDYYGDPVQGNAYYLQGLELARQVDDWQAMGALLQNLGAKAEWSGDYTQADAYYQEGMTCAQRIHDAQRISALLMNIGMLAFRQKQYARAETHYWEVLKLARKTENRMRESAVLQNLGMLAGVRKQWVQAGSYLQESLELAYSTGHKWLFNETLYEIGELHLKQQHIAEAEDVFQTVLANAEQLAAQHLIACALYGLARVEAARHNFTEAYRKGRASQDLFAKMQNVIAKQIEEWLTQLNLDDLSLDQGKSEVLKGSS